MRGAMQNKQSQLKILDEFYGLLDDLNLNNNDADALYFVIKDLLDTDYDDEEQQDDLKKEAYGALREIRKQMVGMYGKAI